MSVIMLFPHLNNLDKVTVISPIEKASHPWSNIKPNGDEFPVRLAYLPSISSNILYKK